MHRTLAGKVKFRAILVAIVVIALISAFLSGYTLAGKSPQVIYTEEQMANWTEAQKYANTIANIARSNGSREGDEIIVTAQELWLTQEDVKAVAESVEAALHQFLFSGILPYEITYDEAWEAAAVALAKTAYGEYNDADWDQYAAVMKAAINRALEQYLEQKAKDEDLEFDPDAIIGVVAWPGQFAYRVGNGTSHLIWVTNEDGTHEIVEYDLLPLARDVLYRLRLNLAGIEDVGFVLPYSCTLPDGTEAVYKYFNGNGDVNRFGYNWPQRGPYWDFSWESPYYPAAENATDPGIILD